MKKLLYILGIAKLLLYLACDLLIFSKLFEVDAVGHSLLSRIGISNNAKWLVMIVQCLLRECACLKGERLKPDSKFSTRCKFFSEIFEPGKKSILYYEQKTIKSLQFLDHLWSKR